MLRQPDIHHKDPITSEFVDGLKNRLVEFIDDVQKRTNPDFVYCKNDWIETLRYAGLRCAAIQTKLDFEFDLTDDDRKCINITLCILRDYEAARDLNFERQEEFP